MSKFTTKDQIEQYHLELLDRLGYSYKHGSTIAPEGAAPERQSFGDVLLKDRLAHAIDNNPTVSSTPNFLPDISVCSKLNTLYGLPLSRSK